MRGAPEPGRRWHKWSPSASVIFLSFFVNCHRAANPNVQCITEDLFQRLFTEALSTWNGFRAGAIKMNSITVLGGRGREDGGKGEGVAGGRLMIQKVFSARLSLPGQRTTKAQPDHLLFRYRYRWETRQLGCSSTFTAACISRFVTVFQARYWPPDRKNPTRKINLNEYFDKGRLQRGHSE